MSIVESRGPSVDLEKVMENTGNNRYATTLAAAWRAMEIRRNNRHSSRREHIFPVITTLKEFESFEENRK